MSGQPRKVLVVDDDKLMVQILFDLFKDDFEVVTATDGSEAIGIIDNHAFAAILCDQIMPEVKGVDVLAHAMEKQDEAARILVTASERVEDVRDAVNLARVHRVVVKPFRDVEVQSIVQGAIREVQLELENARLVKELKARELELEKELQIRTRELKEVVDRAAKAEQDG